MALGMNHEREQRGGTLLRKQSGGSHLAGLPRRLTLKEREKHGFEELDVSPEDETK